MKVLCVLNPLSGGGSAMSRWPQMLEIFRAFDIEPELLSRSDVPIDIQVRERLARGGVSEFKAIAGIGGDGTQSAVINGMMEYRNAHPDAVLPPLGFIPMGTGNDIAKSFGLILRDEFFASDLRRAVSTLVHGADYHLDLGLFDGRYFADALTVGVDSRTLRRRNHRKKYILRVPCLRWLARGPVLYVVSWLGLFNFWRKPSLHVEIRVDGCTWYSGPMLNVVVNNTRIYAGEFDFCTGGYGNDGKLDVVLFTGHFDYLSRYLLSLRHHPRAIRNMATKLGKAASHVQGKHIVLLLSRPEPAQVDGEEMPSGERFDIEVVPQAIHIKTPAEP
ncbi:MAG: diacylglycerol kinase family protein [bacterium]